MTLPDPGLHPGLPIEGIVFDLDGTLVDTAPDITSAVNRLLETHGLPPQAVRFVEKYIGEGSFGLIDKLYKGLDLALEPARVTADVDTYLAFYKLHPVEHSTVYADAFTAVPALHAAGIKLGVCTNKAQELAEAVLKHFGLLHYFSAIVGGDVLPQRKPDPQHLLITLERMNVAPRHALYVGDTQIDADCAQGAHVRCHIVNWGAGPGVAVGTVKRLDSFDELVVTCAAVNASRQPGI